MGAPIAEDFFDIISNWVPPNETPVDAPCRIKVTDFDDGQQLIAISCSHGICDAKALGMFVSAWSASFNGEAVPVVSNDHSFVPPCAVHGQPPLSKVDDIPDAYRVA